jgi:hypothetical protein
MSDKKKFILLSAIVQVLFGCYILSSKDVQDWVVIGPILAGSAFVVLYSYDDDED